MKRRLLALASVFFITALMILGGSSLSSAAEYKIDPAHSFIEFRIQHLSFSWMYGSFNEISGNFTHDPAKPGASRIELEIETDSIDTNHAERDKHLRSDDFLDVKKFPKATFKSTKFTGTAEGGVMEGVLTLHGVSRDIEIEVKKVGEGTDPWKGYRAGFIGTFTLTRSDFGISYNLGPASETMAFDLGIEGIRK